MAELLHFLERHGYAVLFGFVLAEQLGLPLPAIPVLLAVGALSASGQFSMVWVVVIALVAALLGDFTWYLLGRSRGHSILNLLCRISLEPDSCVRRTEEMFARQGGRTLLIAKFVPGLSTVAPPLAGMLRMRRLAFLAWDGAGALLWIGAFAGLGYLFSAQLEFVASLALGLGRWLAVLLGGSLAAYLGWKYAQRRRFIRRLRIARITPSELLQKLEAGEEIAVVDLRQRIAFDAEGVKLPGALHMLAEELEQRHREIPRDREVVLYCT